MENKGSSIKKFLLDNRQVFYSLSLMIIIPALVILNAWVFSNSLRETVNYSLQNKATGIGDGINVGLADSLDSPEEMQNFIDRWTAYNDDVKSLDIFYYEEDTFKLVSSLNKEQIGRTDNAMVYLVAWNKNWPSAQKVAIPTSEQGKFNNYWLVIYPLKDLDGQKQALLSMYLSADVVDTSLSIALMKSFWILIATVILIVMLLFANARLFEYSILYNKIKEVDQMKDEFISMASHELRTPITVIKGYVEMVLEDTNSGLSADAKENLNIVNTSSDRLASLIEDMLNVSRIEQGRLKIEPKEMDAWPLVEETVKEMKIQSDQKGLLLSAVKEPDSKSIVSIDKDRFKQVLINIIGNSIKYTPSGSVEIKVKNNREKNLIIVIKDTGIGMSAKDREKLFQKFYRVKSQKTESITGTGLGLWITKQIIELMKGTISVDSMEGVGTQVTIEIPLIPEK